MAQTTIATEESTLKLRDNLEVYTKTWLRTNASPVAQVVLLHGFSDHCNTYLTFCETLASHAIIVFGFDQRGWGRTSPQKKDWGDTGPTTTLLADIDDVLNARFKAHPDIPLFLFGHSMGGGVALHYGYSGTYRSKLAGLAVWSPMIRLAPEQQPWWIKVTAGKLAVLLIPNFKMVNKLPPEYMSRDPEVCRQFAEDPLCHNTATLMCITEMLKRGEMLERAEVMNKFENSVPLLVAHGTGDKITDFNASKSFVDDVQVSDKKFKEYSMWYHKLHAEPGSDKIKFADEMAEWILEKCHSKSKQSKL